MSKYLEEMGKRAISNLVYVLLKEIELCNDFYGKNVSEIGIKLTDDRCIDTDDMVNSAGISIIKKYHHIVNVSYAEVIFADTFFVNYKEWDIETEFFVKNLIITEIEEGAYIEDEESRTNFKKKANIVLESLKLDNSKFSDIILDAINLAKI